MQENTFWQMIEESWQVVGGRVEERQALAQGELPEDDAFALLEDLEEVVDSLTERLEDLNKEDLVAFDRILERKLYDIDRAEIQEYTDGSDDGFLYCRGFIVAAGQAYYDAVNRDPSRALVDLECEDLCYLPVQIYEDRFGDFPQSDLCRETCSNQQGWADADDLDD